MGNANLMTEEEMNYYINLFKIEGVVEVPIFTPDEVNELRKTFHSFLGIDHEKALQGDKTEIEKIGGPRAKSKAAILFYPKWKIDMITDERIITFARALMNATFATGKEKNFEHPLGPSTDIKLFLDGTQYRLPDHLQAEGGLGPHLDRNPHDPYFLNTPGAKLTKWRPIQSWISLTDQYGADAGGLRVVKGFHLECEEYFKHSSQQEQGGSGGEFYRLNSKTHASLCKRLEPVNAAAGSIVFWDNRLVHATSEKLISDDTREVVFTAYIPSVPLNVEYTSEQLKNIQKSPPLPPPQYVGRRITDECELDWTWDQLSPDQQILLSP